MYVERTHGARNQMRRMPGPPAEIYRLAPAGVGSKRGERAGMSQVGGWREDASYEMLRSA